MIILAGRPVPFYPWIRQIALDRLADFHRRHVHASNGPSARDAPAAAARRLGRSIGEVSRG